MPSRRELIKGVLAGSAGLFSAGSIGSCNRALRRRVVVIGAGFAGLACAYELAVAGYDITVLEARKRLGGRVLTLHDFIPGKWIEAGGELIGSNHPTLLAYAHRFGLKLVPVTRYGESSTPTFLNGKRLSDAEARALYRQMEQGIEILNKDARAIDADRPWLSPGASELDRRSLQDVIQSLHIGDLGKQGLTAQFAHNMGLPPSQMSYLGILTIIKGHGVERYWTDSELFRCDGGSQQLADRLAARLGAERVYLGTAVNSISVERSGAVAGCDAQRSYEADDIVLTVPPSTWSKIQFEPPLPANLQPQMGSNVKYLASVKSRYWLDSHKPTLVDSLSDGGLGMTWEGTDGQTANGPAGLISFSGASTAEEWHRTSGAERQARFRKDFETLLPGFQQNLLRDRFVDWLADPWTLGGYSCPAPGTLTVYGPALLAGLGRLHFAGEHTCYKFMGFMEGALCSGVAAARRLAARDGLVKS